MIINHEYHKTVLWIRIVVKMGCVRKGTVCVPQTIAGIMNSKVATYTPVKTIKICAKIVLAQVEDVFGMAMGGYLIGIGHLYVI